jgi:hypothetical protein
VPLLQALVTDPVPPQLWTHMFGGYSWLADPEQLDSRVPYQCVMQVCLAGCGQQPAQRDASGDGMVCDAGAAPAQPCKQHCAWVSQGNAVVQVVVVRV